MSSNQSSTSNLKFFTVAAELKLLSADQVDELASQSTADGIHPAHLVMRKGLLNAVEIDIIETLLNPTETIADFEILGLLGKGGMGVVYRARQKSLGRVVALKTILVSQLADPALAARFEREAMTVARLQHPNIVAAYDFGKKDGRMYFMMELVEGQDVDQLIHQQGKLDEAVALGLIRQAAAGLAHATELNIVHRDIKPANLLLVDPPAGFQLPSGLPMVKIADFGLAFLASESQDDTRLTAANTTLGSPNYMAPEQISGESVDHRADIYALGASLYHMLAGHPPFQAKTISQIIAQKLSGKFKPVHEINLAVSQQTSQLIQEMMNHDLDSRLSDYNVLMNRLDGLLQNSQPASALPTQVFKQSEVQPRANELEKTILATSKDTESLTGKKVAGSSQKRLLRWLIPGLVLIALLAGAFFFSSQADKQNGYVLPQRDMIRSGWSKSLFNGKTLSGLPLSGGWLVEEDDESGQVIAGNSGTIRQPLFNDDPKSRQPLANYRLQFFVRLHHANAVELQFGITISDSQEGERSVLRITPEQIILGSKESEGGNLGTILHDMKHHITKEKLHVIQLEYQHGTWWVSFDEQLIGTVPSPELKKHLPEFRLKVEKGPAWFSDLSVEELIPKPVVEN